MPPKRSKKGKRKDAARAAQAATKAASAGPTLHVLEVSSNSHAVMALAKVCKLDVDVHAMDMTKGETRAPEFVAKNPFHCCPTLEEGGFVLWETHAVMRYLCNKHNLHAWYPAEADDRARVEQALDWRHCNMYPALAKYIYPKMGFAAPLAKKADAEALKALGEHLEMMDSFYLADNKFIAGFETPTIADLSIRPAMKFLEAADYKFSASCEAYMQRVDAALPEYVEVAKPLAGFIQQLKANNATAADAKKAAADAELAAVGHKKKVKACIKEGGKKGQDLCGMSTFGNHFFLTVMDEPQGDMEYLKLCMEGANAEIDPEGEDRKGGAGDLAKIFFTAGETNLAMLCHVPKEVQDKASMVEFFTACLKPVGVEAVKIDEFNMYAEMAADPENDRFPLKLRDVAISAGFEYLKAKQLILDDDSDDDINFADECGIDLNAGAQGSDY